MITETFKTSELATDRLFLINMKRFNTEEARALCSVYLKCHRTKPCALFSLFSIAVLLRVYPAAQSSRCGHDKGQAVNISRGQLVSTRHKAVVCTQAHSIFVFLITVFFFLSSLIHHTSCVTRVCFTRSWLGVK